MINKKRMEKDFEMLATFSATPGEGVTRSSYSKEDQQAKEYLITEMHKIGLKTWEDGVGTLFGRREGSDASAPAIMIGSHYDSVVNGGAYDGAAGTLAALEVMRVLEENNVANTYPIEMIAMNAEEGETFGPSTGVTNSRAIVGTLTEEELDTKRNRFGQTKREAMLAYGLIPNLEKAKRKRGAIKNFIELHIEQGPVLEASNKTIGLVGFLPGIGRYKIAFFGTAGDSTVPLNQRADALLAAAMFTQEVHDIMADLGEGITGSVNEMNISPNSNQFIANDVEVKVEVRTFDAEVLANNNLTELLLSALKRVEQKTSVRATLTEMRRIGYPNPTPPSVMCADNIAVMEQICQEEAIDYLILNNGTGHDSMIMTDFAPTNMIYVPSKAGVSHHPDEWTAMEDIATGANVLLKLVLKLAK